MSSRARPVRETVNATLPLLHMAVTKLNCPKCRRQEAVDLINEAATILLKHKLSEAEDDQHG